MLVSATSSYQSLTSYSGDTFYDASTTESYTWGNDYPQGCKCVAQSSDGSSCRFFKCSCNCDVTAGRCNYGCCCDPDCTSDQIDRFQSLDTCLYEGGSATDSITYCYSSADLYAVNPRGPLAGTPTATEAISRALCVEKKNYVFPSQFYDDTTVQASSIFKTNNGEKEYSYTDTSAINIGTASVDAYYDQNDTIAAYTTSSISSSTFITNGAGFLQIPAADFQGQCNDFNYASFENPVKGSACRRVFDASTAASFASQCAYEQSMARYVSDLYVAKSASTQASTGVVSSSDLLAVQLNKVLFADPSTGNLYDVTSQWTTNNCGTTYIANISSATTSELDCIFSRGPSLNRLLNSSSMVCASIVQGITYTVNHSSAAEGTLLSIEAVVTITDLGAYQQNSANELSIDQEFSVEYFSINTADISRTNGNQVKRKRSGSPGYQLGLPVVYGYLSGTVIDELVSGLSLPHATGKGICPTGSDNINTISTAFGYDTIAACSVALNRQQLIDFCCTGAPGTCSSSSTTSTFSNSEYVSTSSGLAYFLNFTQGGYVGIYGSADPLDVTQWFAISYSKPTDSRVWSDVTSTCSNVYSGFNIQFLISSSGERANPQNKIVAALVEVVTSDWVLSGVAAKDNTTTQNFQVSIMTSFVSLQDQGLQGYIPPAPPTAFKVPYDIFYPFVANSAPRQSNNGLIAYAMVSVSMVMMIIMVGM
jgi:tectonic-1/3